MQCNDDDKFLFHEYPKHQQNSKVTIEKQAFIAKLYNNITMQTLKLKKIKYYDDDDCYYYYNFVQTKNLYRERGRGREREREEKKCAVDNRVRQPRRLCECVV